MRKEDFTVSNFDVLITIGGLALCCYNKRKKVWQVVFPEDKHHRLGIDIFRYDKNDPKGSPENYFRVAKGELGDGNKRKITVQTQGERQIEGGKHHYEGENFSWVDFEKNDKKDFRYIIDLENKYLTHGKQKKVKNDNVVLLTLENTFLFTHKLSDDSYQLYDEKGINPTKKVLHKVGKIIGGNILINPEATNANVKLKIENYKNPDPLINFSRYRYEIKFDNDCPNKAASEKDETITSCDSDFPVYYTLVKPEDSGDKSRFNLKKDGIEAKGRIDCDGAWMSQSDGLF